MVVQECRKFDSCLPWGKELCPLSGKERRMPKSLREGDPEMLRFSDKKKDSLTYLEGYIWGQERVTTKPPLSLFPLDLAKGKGTRSCV